MHKLKAIFTMYLAPIFLYKCGTFFESLDSDGTIPVLLSEEICSYRSGIEKTSFVRIVVNNEQTICTVARLCSILHLKKDI
jgi:hypothetical protein